MTNFTKKYRFIFLLILGSLSSVTALATVGQTATIEGVVISFTQTTVMLSQRGRIQKIPRKLIPEKVDLKAGMFLTIEIPVTH
jgi:RNase P/RNase MRP subunit p29